MKKQILIIIFLILIIALLAVITFWPKENKPKEVKIINEVKAYGYILEDDETTLHRSYFDSLVDVLKSDEVDEEEYAKLVVQLFISDFFNLDNKITKNNVGGLQYVHLEARDNMALKAKDTIYKYVESNLYNDREQELPIVSDITIDSINPITFTYNDEKDDKSYEIKASWTYAKDLGYQREAIFKLMHEGKKLSIVEISKQ